ncbi:hypothetical protein, partial [Serratia marcescens]|uniref:hypothetical protein n=1 Tax=Serratia marcescens TaxID=615 RepID=UPI0013DB2BFE
ERPAIPRELGEGNLDALCEVQAIGQLGQRIASQPQLRVELGDQSAGGLDRVGKDGAQEHQGINDQQGRDQHIG